MGKIHRKIIREVSKKLKSDKAILGIVVFGSCSIGKERKNSDVDIEIISKKVKEYNLYQKREMYGINLDLEYINPKVFMRITKDYPYLWYDYYKRNKIILDKLGIVKKVMNILKNYYKKHPEVCKFWEEKLKKMKHAKNIGEIPENAYDVFDEAEKLFSDKHEVTRNFFRKKVKSNLLK